MITASVDLTKPELVYLLHLLDERQGVLKADRLCDKLTVALQAIAAELKEVTS